MAAVEAMWRHGMVSRTAGQLLSIEDPAELIEGVARLLQMLQNHFRAEEKEGGLFERILAGTPRTRDALDQLCREHRELIRDLADLHAGLIAETTGTADAHWVLKSVFTRLEHHERVEVAMSVTSVQR